ncbi:hypothetical protein D3C72_2198170 [compost metagenome]
MPDDQCAGVEVGTPEEGRNNDADVGEAVWLAHGGLLVLACAMQASGRSGQAWWTMAGGKAEEPLAIPPRDGMGAILRVFQLV